MRWCSAANWQLGWQVRGHCGVKDLNHSACPTFAHSFITQGSAACQQEAAGRGGCCLASLTFDNASRLRCCCSLGKALGCYFFTPFSPLTERQMILSTPCCLSSSARSLYCGTCLLLQMLV